MTTGIEWTDETWNPVRGCTRVSPECVNCYAERQAIRHAREGNPYHGLVRSTSNGPQWTGAIRTVPELLEAPLHWKQPKRIFVNSMSDLFHEDVPDEYIDQIFAVMCRCCSRFPEQRLYSHTFQILTKRAERMQRYMADPRRAEQVFIACHKTPLCGRSSEPAWPLPNVWLGVSAGNQQYADERIPLLLQTPAAVRFVSYEPALGPIDFTPYVARCDGVLQCPKCGFFTNRWAAEPCPNDGEQLRASTRINWLIAGGESGPNARPAHPDWFRSARDQCAATGVAFFFKQWGEWEPRDEWSAHRGGGRFEPMVAIMPDGSGCPHNSVPQDVGAWRMAKVGKKTSGRLLDGREHSEFPA